MAHLFWSFLNTFLTRGFSLIFIVVLGNFLLPETLGYYVALILVVDYVGSLACVQTGEALIYKLNSVAPEERCRYFASGWISITGMALLVVFIAFCFSSQIADVFDITEAQNLLLFCLPLVILKTNRLYLTKAMHADLCLKQEAVINFIAAVLQIFVCVMLLIGGYGLYGVITAIYFGDMAALILLVVFCIRNLGVSFKSLRQPLKEIFHFSIYSHVSMATVFLDKNIDLFFVTYFLSKISVASYNYAIKFGLLFLMVGNSVSRVTYPRLAKAAAKSDWVEFSRIYRLSMNFAFFGLSCVGLWVIIHAEFLIHLVLPSNYLNIIPTLTILIAGLAIFGAFISVGTVFSAIGKPGYDTIINIPALGINVLLCVTLVPTWGMNGAAIATAISFALRAFLGMAFVKYILRLDCIYMRFCTFIILFLAVLTFMSLADIGVVWAEILFVAYTLIALFFQLNRSDRQYLLRYINFLRKKA